MPLFPNQDGEVPIDCFSVSLLKPDGYLMLRWLVGWRCEALPVLNPAFDPVTWHCIHTIRYESPGESQRRTQNQHSYVSSFIARRISSIMMFCWPSMLHAFNCTQVTVSTRLPRHPAVRSGEPREPRTAVPETGPATRPDPARPG